MVDERKRARKHQRGPQPLNDAHDDQRSGGAGKPATHRGGGKQAHAGEVDALGPEPIAEMAPGEQKGCKCECIGVDNPLQARNIGGQRPRDRRERDVDDGHVELDECKTEAGCHSRPSRKLRF